MSVLDGPLVFVDVETTGMSYHRDRVIEVAALRVENRRLTGSLNTLVDPQMELPPFISGLTGISGSDLKSAPSFYDIAGELKAILEDAVFVAHNVRFDFGFLKREFRNAGINFNPKQLCTVRLSRSLFPAERHHKLQDLIDRCGLDVSARHRAFDDAQAMWQFIQHVVDVFPAPAIDAAISLQLKSPSLPKNLDPVLIRDLPQSPGVYIFLDEKSNPLYIGKSINIKQRVLSHFSSDHSFESEFKIAQQVADIQAIVTGGELEALLLESALVKERQPIYNRQLRRQQKMTLARQVIKDGFIGVDISDVDTIEPDSISGVLSVYKTKGQARQFLEQIIKDYGLCPRLMGLDKGRGACFAYQLKKCGGACAGQETPLAYNQRLLAAFENRRLAEWPFKSPVIISEKNLENSPTAIVVDQWCVVASLSEEIEGQPLVKFQEKMFDIDTYKILRSFLASKVHKLTIKPISLQQLSALAA